MLSLHRVIVPVLAAAVLTASSIPELAQAADADEALSYTLHYRSADLDTADGVADFYRRIRAAAERVCRPLEGRPLRNQVLWKDCFNLAVANAVQAVHNQPLSAYHWQRSGGFKQPRIELPTSLAAR
jgi:UrcA family protein